MNKFQQPSDPTPVLEDIARKCLDIDTLETPDILTAINDDGSF